MLLSIYIILLPPQFIATFQNRSLFSLWSHSTPFDKDNSKTRLKGTLRVPCDTISGFDWIMTWLYKLNRCPLLLVEYQQYIIYYVGILYIILYETRWTHKNAHDCHYAFDISTFITNIWLRTRYWSTHGRQWKATCYTKTFKLVKISVR